jgi:hypothetical protein
MSEHCNIYLHLCLPLYLHCIGFVPYYIKIENIGSHRNLVASIDKKHQSESTNFRPVVIMLITTNIDKNTEYDQLNLDFEFL